ncbi:MAG: DNA topoisomerase VI subunit B [Lentisphaerae bacterium]|nr:DNA topoisomerase VI subunit B [Lentisphaerota bacterium]
MAKPKTSVATAETMAGLQRDISVSEFFLKNRHLLGFDNPKKALLTTVKEAVDNSLDACDEAGILPEISVDIRQLADKRFRVAVLDNGPGIVRAQIPKIFAKLLYGSKFHRLRMSRGQQGIGISAAGMYGQLTTGTSTVIQSKIKNARTAHHIEVQIDTRQNKPVILKDTEVQWQPEFFPTTPEGTPKEPVRTTHGTCVSIEMEAAYVKGRQSVDEYVAQCAIVNPHLQLHYRLSLLPSKPAAADGDAKEAVGQLRGGLTAPVRDVGPSQRDSRPRAGISADKSVAAERDGHLSAKAILAPTGSPTVAEAMVGREGGWTTYFRATTAAPKAPMEIKPHPHGVELGMLMQMLKDTDARWIKSALAHDFSRVSDRTAAEICQRAGLDPKAKPATIAHRESEALFKAINETKLMRPPTDCLSPIGEDQIVAGLKKQIQADFYTAVTRSPDVYRGNPFQIEVGLAYAKPGDNEDVAAEEPVRLMRFANKVPLLYMGGACAMSKAMMAVNWKSYGLSQPKGSLPLGPLAVMIHIASVWVPFTSESKEAIAHYPEIVREIVFALQEAGRQLGVFLSRRRRQLEMERKRSYMEKYLPHLALGLRQILALSEKDESGIVAKLKNMLEKTHLEV